MCLFPVFNRPRAEVQDQGRETESRGEGAGGEIHNRGGEKRPHSSASAGFKKGTGGASAATMSHLCVHKPHTHWRVEAVHAVVGAYCVHSC